LIFRSASISAERKAMNHEGHEEREVEKREKINEYRARK